MAAGQAGDANDEMRRQQVTYSMIIGCTRGPSIDKGKQNARTEHHPQQVGHARIRRVLALPQTGVNYTTLAP